MLLPADEAMPIEPSQVVCRAKRSVLLRGGGVAFVVLLSAGCQAAFPTNRLPKLNDITSTAQVSNKRTVCLALRFMRDSGDHKPIGIPTALPQFQHVTEKVITEAALFSSHTFESCQAKDMDYVLQMEMTNYGSHSTVGPILTGITLYVVPCAATDNYTLTAKLFDHNGQLLKTYSYDDGITTWLGIWFIPMVGKGPVSVAHGVWENMIRTLFRDIRKDNLLSYS